MPKVLPLLLSYTLFQPCTTWNPPVTLPIGMVEVPVHIAIQHEAEIHATLCEWRFGSRRRGRGRLRGGRGRRGILRATNTGEHKRSGDKTCDATLPHGYSSQIWI